MPIPIPIPRPPRRHVAYVRGKRGRSRGRTRAGWRACARDWLLTGLLCAAVAACAQDRLDGSSERSFRASLTTMNSHHTVEEAQQLGGDLETLSTKIGRADARKRLDGMSYAQARAYLDAELHPAAPAHD